MKFTLGPSVTTAIFSPQHFRSGLLQHPISKPIVAPQSRTDLESIRSIIKTKKTKWHKHQHPRSDPYTGVSSANSPPHPRQRARSTKSSLRRQNSSNGYVKHSPDRAQPETLKAKLRRRNSLSNTYRRNAHIQRCSSDIIRVWA